jgi:hypothetical protein
MIIDDMMINDDDCNFFLGTAINFLERESDFKHLEDIEKYYRYCCSINVVCSF